MKQNSNPTHSGSKPLSIDAVFMPITKVNYTIQVEDNLSIALEKNFQNSNSFDMQKNQASSTPKSIREKTNHIIVLDIWTNGSIHPREALYSASNKLLKLFATIEKIQIRNSLLFKPFVGSEKTYETVLNRLQTLSASSSAETASGIAEPTNSFTKIKFLSKNAKEYWTLKKLQITEIQNLNISLRPYTCLQRADIKTLYDLVNYSKSDLLKIKNLGFKSLNEIDQSLIALGIQMQEI
jgi:DNA-directed RNA polymerase alpha subunit